MTGLKTKIFQIKKLSNLKAITSAGIFYFKNELRGIYDY